MTVSTGAPHDPNPPVAPAAASSASVLRRAQPALGVSALAFVLYVATLHHGPGGRMPEGWGDAAKWQYIGSVLGVPHPPGCPLYILGTFVWGSLPVPGLLATRINLLSAVFGATTIGLQFALLRRIGLSIMASALGAMTLATALGVWHFSTEAELYMPFLAMALGTLWCFLRWSETRRMGHFAAGCVLYALGFGDHQLLITLLPALVWIVATTAPRTFVSCRHVGVVMAAIACGLLPFVWLLWRTASAPYSEFSGTRDLSGFLDYALARQYRSGMFALGPVALVRDRIPQCAAVLREHLPVVILLAGTTGLGLLVRRGRVIGGFFLLAALGPLAFWVNYPTGDPLGFSLPFLPSVALGFALVADALAARISRRAVPVVWVVAFGLWGFGAYATGARLLPSDPMQPTPPVQAEDFTLDWACSGRVAREGTIFVEPRSDYGSRQMALYHAFTDPAFAGGRRRIVNTDSPEIEWTWAEPAWWPDDDERAPIVVFRQWIARRLRFQGWTVDEVTDRFAPCLVGAVEDSAVWIASRPGRR